ncbi:MAG: transcription-repair coupling factor [Gammaproteobacteria bacterium]|nr:transcription-repair coupling factor [Gammaproteobacteria bacterium]
MGEARSPLQARFAPSGSDTTAWSGLHGSSLALALERAAEASAEVHLLVARSSHQAAMLKQDLDLLASGSVPILLMPDRETLPYDPFSAHPDIVSQRLAALSALAKLEKGLVIVPAAILMQRLPPVSHVLANHIDLAPGQSLDIAAFRDSLVRSGYEVSEQVYQSGQFAVRGSVMDLYPSGLDQPVRIDLFDDEIDSIRYFDVETQRSDASLEQLSLAPAREYPGNPAAFDAFRRAFRYRFAVDTRKISLYQDLRQGVHPQGLEQYLPLFFDDTEHLFNYFNTPPSLVLQHGYDDSLQALWLQVQERWEQRRHDTERPVLEPDELFFNLADIQARMMPLDQLLLAESPVRGIETKTFDSAEPPRLDIHERGHNPAEALQSFASDFPGRIMFAADSAGRREFLTETLAAFDIRPRRFDAWRPFMESDAATGICVLPVGSGFVVPGELAVITETELFGGRARTTVSTEAAERDPESIIRNLADLETGAPVVHEDHGIGRYQGLEVLEIDGRPAEFLMLEYAGKDKLYVPVSSLHLISRYTGSAPESAPLHRLGSDQWAKVRKRAAKQVRDVAAELLDLYARREARQGHGFELDAKLYAEFCAGFPFEETPDQQQSIASVLRDMESSQPMDRVVCGDVGFGKTEVALRAAFVAVQGGRQVALLVPTTLLAQQHHSTFSDRFADWPVRIELLSRFRTGKQSAKVLEDLENGKVDIVIGTHRLLQSSVKFERLGLVIVDEEQRFGVRQKERLKQLRAEVDLLTLTATPIPRTLNMALSGIRELSIIATPPARRMAVKTLILEWDRAMMREALARELQRGGQVFFLHNEVRSIQRIAREVAELAPNARIAVAHGQMKEKELEKIMLDFYRQRFNVLVCTTIIENGIDVPTANTIIVNRADKFGLAQLHQLRGRVGRSHHRAYAYLVVPDRRSMTRDALKRLEAIASMEELGAGFTLATHDMEIRGAGELLGEEQSGQIQQIGFSLYSELLTRAVNALRHGQEPELEGPLRQGIEIDFHVAALIPDDYLPDVHSRLTLYKRIASAADEAALRDLQVEMIDRFGLLPDVVRNLFRLASLRLEAAALGINRIDIGEQGGRIEFDENSHADPAGLVALIREQPERYKMSGPLKLRIEAQLEDPAERMELAASLLSKLAN